VLDQLQIERAVFLGTSLGAIVTMMLVSTAPQRVAAAILNDAGARLEQAGLARIASYVGKGEPVRSWQEAAAAAKAVNSPAYPEAPDGFWTCMARRTFRQNADGSIETDYDPAIAQPMNGPPTALDMTPLFRGLAGIPILIVHGAASDLLSSAGVAASRALKPDLVVAEVPNVGHAPTLEEPDAWEPIVGFLARVP